MSAPELMAGSHSIGNSVGLGSHAIARLQPSRFETSPRQKTFHQDSASSPASSSSSEARDPVADLYEVGLNHLESFLCPITKELMRDPVTTVDGHCYDRQAISLWFQRSRKAPVTGAILSSIDLTPNHALRTAIEEYHRRIMGDQLRAQELEEESKSMTQRLQQEIESRGAEIERLRLKLRGAEIELEAYLGASSRSAGGSDVEQPSSIPEVRIRSDAHNKIWLLYHKDKDGKMQIFRISWRACGGNQDEAERIARLCSLKLRDGASEEEAKVYRLQLYEQLKKRKQQQAAEQDIGGLRIADGDEAALGKAPRLS